MVRGQQHPTTEQIWGRLSGRLRQFVQARVKSESDVDDILQTVFLRIHGKLGTLHFVDRLDSWVFQITRNAVADHFRILQALPSDDGLHSSSIALEHEEDMNSEVASCLRGLIDQLPPEQKRAVSMYEFEDKSQKEIAEFESISLSAAKSRIQRGRKNLEAMLLGCCEFQFDRRRNILNYESAGKQTCFCFSDPSAVSTD